MAGSAEFRALVLEEREGKVVSDLRMLDNSALPEGDVLVRVGFSDLNYKDGLVVKGLGKLVRKYPHVPGIDFSGVVEESASSRFSPGDEVILTGWRVGEVHWGGYAGMARIPAAEDERVEFEQPAQLTHGEQGSSVSDKLIDERVARHHIGNDLVGHGFPPALQRDVDAGKILLNGPQRGFDRLQIQAASPLAGGRSSSRRARKLRHAFPLLANSLPVGCPRPGYLSGSGREGPIRSQDPRGPACPGRRPLQAGEGSPYPLPTAGHPSAPTSRSP